MECGCFVWCLEYNTSWEQKTQLRKGSPAIRCKQCHQTSASHTTTRHATCQSVGMAAALPCCFEVSVMLYVAFLTPRTLLQLQTCPCSLLCPLLHCDHSTMTTWWGAPGMQTVYSVHRPPGCLPTENGTWASTSSVHNVRESFFLSTNFFSTCFYGIFFLVLTPCGLESVLSSTRGSCWQLLTSTDLQALTGWSSL